MSPRTEVRSARGTQGDTEDQGRWSAMLRRAALAWPGAPGVRLPDAPGGTGAPRTTTIFPPGGFCISPNKVYSTDSKGGVVTPS